MTDQMRFTILQEINIAQFTILQLLFNKSNQVECWPLMRGKDLSEQSRDPTNSIYL